MDGSYPRQPLAVFLPLTEALKEDGRLPVDPNILPVSVYHCWEKTKEAFVVEYGKKVLCKDGVLRRRLFYQCRPYHKDIKNWFTHSAKDKKGHCAAEAAAWKHVETVLSRGGHPTQVFPEFGQGELEPKKEEFSIEATRDLAWATREKSAPRWDRTIRIRVQDVETQEVYVDEYVTETSKSNGHLDALFEKPLPEPRPLTTSIWYIGKGYHFHGEDSHHNVFHCHRDKPNFLKSGTAVWNNRRDTFLKPGDYCTNAEYQRTLKGNVSVWRCKGHRKDTWVADEMPRPEWLPIALAEEPLGRKGDLAAATLTEHYAGDQKRGGGRLSEVWELSGGRAERRDLLIDESHDVTKDDVWWDAHIERPSNLESFALPCTSFSIAHVTGPLGQTRSKDNPWGDEADESVKKGNAVARITIVRMLQVMAKGGAILVENPLLSFFWWLPEVLTIIGMPGMFLIRMDDCMFGEPYRKARLWLTNIENLTCAGAVCNHDLPHPEALDGGRRNRQTATYPYGVVATIVEVIAANWDGQTALGSEESRLAAEAFVDDSMVEEELKELYRDKGRKNVADVRSGHSEYAEGCTKKDIAATKGPAVPPEPTSEPEGTAEAGPDEGVKEEAVSLSRRKMKGRDFAKNPADFEKKNIFYLQKLDPDFKDIIEMCEWTPSPEGPQADEALEEARKRFKETLTKNGVAHAEANKRAEAARKEMKMYELEEVLYRMVQQPGDGGYERRVVVPKGDLKSFTNLGRKFKLTYRRRLLLHYHDGEMEGTHPGVEETTAKIAQKFWWPTLKKDVVKWVRSCAVCTLVKPQPCLTAAERSELHSRPFRTLFMDTIGPIHPKSDGKHFIAHVECPFSKFPWLKGLEKDDAASWAQFLVDEVFFDLAGFPAVLRSDRGGPFVSDTVRAVNQLLGIQQAFGSSYHPQSQGFIEARHKPINKTIKAYTGANPHKWARYIKLAQWAMRATPRADLGGRSPYELITGLRPQGPLTTLFEKMNAKTVTPSEYVQGLQKNLEAIQKQVATSYLAELDAKLQKREGDAKSNWVPDVGDTVFLRRPPTGAGDVQGVSRKLLSLCYNRLFRVKKVLGPSTYFLVDADTGDDQLGFPQPVALDRLVPYDLCEMETPIDDKEPLRIEIVPEHGGGTHRIVSQSATGKVRTRNEANGEEQTVDLARLDWRWLQ